MLCFFLIGSACVEVKPGGSLNTYNWTDFIGETTLKDFEVVLVISNFVSGPGASAQTTVIFFRVKLGVAPDINALATIVISIVGLGVVVAVLSFIARNSAEFLKLR